MSVLSPPSNWSKARVGDLFDFCYGKALPRSNRTKEGKVPVYGSNGITGYHDEPLIEGPCLLVGRKGAAGRVSKAPNGCWPIDTTYYIEIPDGLDFEFCFHLFRFQRFEKFEKSTAIPSLSRDDAYEQEITIPPLAEQRRIVGKIEELFSELDAGVSALKQARAQLAVYRQALLRDAFEGRLTAEWRAKHADQLESADHLLNRIRVDRASRYQEHLADWQSTIGLWEQGGKVGKRPTKPRPPEEPEKPSSEHTSRLWALPDAWQWIQIGTFAFVTKLAGFEYTDYVRYSENGDLRVIKAENAGPHGFRVTDYSRIKSESIAHLKRSVLVGGELLVVFVGAGTGNVATVPSGTSYFLGPNIAMARAESDAVSTRYLELFLRSPGGRDMILAASKAVAQPSLSMETIRQAPIAVPPTLEQVEIVRLLEEQLLSITSLEADIDMNLQKAEALRQAILKKAFAGELVPQDPNDEPAAELLARIQAERAASSAAKAPLKHPRKRGKVSDA